MKIKNLVSAIAATSLAVSPMAAQATEARTGTTVESAEELAGGGIGLIIALLASAAILYFAIDSSGEGEPERPVSP